MRVLQKPLSEIIAEELRKRIWNKEIKFGDRLYEAYLAEELEVSRSSLREALQTLEFEGLVVNQARKGTFVSKFTKDDIKEINEVRYTLETHAFISAMEHLKEEDFKELEKIITEIKGKAAEKEWSKVANLDLDFHLYIVKLCGNSRIIKLYELIRVQIRTVMAQLDNFYENNNEALWAEHMDLVKALKTKNKLLIREILPRHVEDA